jgi:hypothetical protein
VGHAIRARDFRLHHVDLVLDVTPPAVPIFIGASTIVDAGCSDPRPMLTCPASPR